MPHKNKCRIPAYCLLLSAAMLAGCYGIRPSSGGGKGDIADKRRINAQDIALPEGYTIEAIVTGLTFPTGITFDDQGLAYVVEAGYSYGEEWTGPRLLRIEPDGGATSLITEGVRNGPWNGITFHGENFYVAEGGEMEGGRILRISRSGEITALVDNLPSTGDHHTNGPVVHNGSIYFGQGTATNSGVVGEDNAQFGWLKRYPDFHDIPCETIVLNGINYESNDPLSENGKVKTGAFVPFKTTTTDGQVIQGSIPCSGSVLKIPLTGGPPELVAWGFRNPFGLTFHEDKLYVTDNSYDDRGSRPAWGTGDVLWKVEQGQWYGWPDYAAGSPITYYNVPGKSAPQVLLKEAPNQPPSPAAVLGVHSSSNGIDFPVSAEFGFSGQAFIAQFGDMAPNVGKVLGPVGFKVVAVDPETGVITDFAVNKGKKNGPASWLKKGGLERPVAVQFHPAGQSLYVVDFGVVEISDGKVISRKGTGVVWKITKQ